MDKLQAVPPLVPVEPQPLHGSGRLARPLPWLKEHWESGPASLLNLNAYAFGLSAVVTGIGTGMVPLIVGDLLDRSGSVHFLWLDLEENGAIALVSLCGLIIAAFVQPLTGYLSDRTGGGVRGRTPYMAAGALALTVSALSLAQASTFGAILLVIVAIQASANVVQGPANALLLDSVPASRLGTAAGTLNAYKVAGAGIFLVIVFLLMGNYDGETNRVWLWFSLALVVAVMVTSSAWSVLSLRSRARKGLVHRIALAEEQPGVRPAIQEAGSRKRYIWFLLSLTFVIAAMSAMQVYSIPFLRHSVGLENPAHGAALLALVLGVTVTLAAIPAGKLQDRLGSRPLLAVGGLLGATGALLLIAVDSLPGVAAVGVVVGLAIGIFISVTWAMANSLVPKGNAARDLGYTGMATLSGAAIARLAGPLIDILNDRSPDLGYTVFLGVIAAAFIVTPVLLGIATTARKPIKLAGGLSKL